MGKDKIKPDKGLARYAIRYLTGKGIETTDAQVAYVVARVRRKRIYRKYRHISAEDLVGGGEYGENTHVKA